jgi:hypothetical protein
MIFLVEIVKFGIVLLKLTKENFPILTINMLYYNLSHQTYLTTAPNPFVAILEKVSTAREL